MHAEKTKEELIESLIKAGIPVADLVLFIKLIVEESNVTNVNDNLIDNKISLILNYLHLPVELSGYTYFHDSLQYLLSKDKKTCNVTTDLYPKLAKKYSKSSQAIQHSMSHAIKRMYLNVPKNHIIKIFGNDCKITNSNFIFTLFNLLSCHSFTSLSNYLNN